MPARTVEAPGSGQFLTTDEACAWLHVSEGTFDSIVEAEGWVRPTRIGRKGGRVLWHWLDIFVLGHVLSRRSETGTGPPGEEPGKKS